MVKHVILLMTAMFVLLCLVGCGVSESKVTKTVRASLQKTLNSDPQYSEYDLLLTDLQVVKQDKFSYKGTAKVEYAGKPYDVPLAITVNGSTVEWDLEPGAFSFLKR